MASRFAQYQANCTACGSLTTKKYAREHNGLCKSCIDPTAPVKGPKCPQCGAPISAYKAANHYVCEGCVKQNDPVGWSNEVRGFND